MSDPDDNAISLALAEAAGDRNPAARQPVHQSGRTRAARGSSTSGASIAPGSRTYDIVGWDPRGVGGSTPVKCFTGADLDHYYSIDTSPDDAVELQQLIEDRKAFGRSCLGRSGTLLAHISTTETVRDLDLLRGSSVTSKINYFGSSYGTRIGSLYAQLFTDRVGRMVLDGAVSLDPNPEITQLQGFERALDHFADWCATERCRLGANRDEVLSMIKDFLDQLDQRPAVVEGGRTLSQQQGVEAVFFTLYGGQQGWRALRDALTPAILDGNAQGMLRLSDVSNRRTRDGSYDQLSYAFPAIRCLDSPDDSVRRAQKDLAAGEPEGARARPAEWCGSAMPAVAGRIRPAAPADHRRRRAPDPGDRHDRRSGDAVRVRTGHGRSTEVRRAGDLQRRGTPGVRQERMRDDGSSTRTWSTMWCLRTDRPAEGSTRQSDGGASSRIGRAFDLPPRPRYSWRSCVWA